MIQLLDVTSFGSFKSMSQKYLHRAIREEMVLDFFDIGSIVCKSYQDSFTPQNIRDWFIKTGFWNPSKRIASIDALKILPIFAPGSGMFSASDLMQRYEKNRRSLLCDANVEETGTVAVNTTSGAHLTADCFLYALKRDTINALPQ